VGVPSLLRILQSAVRIADFGRTPLSPRPPIRRLGGSMDTEHVWRRSGSS
jgi:hypothetical protein